MGVKPMSLLWDKLKKHKTARDGYSRAHFDIELPFQVAKLMKDRGITIDDLVEAGIPKAELEGDEEYSRETLHRLAAIFDVGLLITFASFSHLVKRERNFDLRRFSVPSFKDDTDPTEIEALLSDRVATLRSIVHHELAHVQVSHWIESWQLSLPDPRPLPIGRRITFSEHTTVHLGIDVLLAGTPTVS